MHWTVRYTEEKRIVFMNREKRERERERERTREIICVGGKKEKGKTDRDREGMRVLAK